MAPWHLMKKYVQLTKDHGQPDGPLFLSILSPYTPLTADRIGSITLHHLKSLGVPQGWGAHSTRGAAVAMYKKLGLSSEEVAELGKWKDIKTFSEYYLRLHACQRACDQLSIFVHNVSPLECAEPDMSTSRAPPFAEVHA